MKKLNELYDGYPEIPITGIKINSKDIEPGDLFVCTIGVTADRHDFVEEAIQKGASAIIASKKIDVSVPVVYVEDTNLELPLVAAKFYDYPERALRMIGVTGTNGKTTVAQMVQDMIGSDLCAYMGTNGLICKDFHQMIRNTTPDSDRLYGYFRRFVDHGCSILSMETSSEAFFRKRLMNLEFEVGIITNITEDHLNIHKTIENYVESKLELLKQVKETGTCILNTEDRYFDREKAVVTSKLLTYGKKHDADLVLQDVKMFCDHTEITFFFEQKEYFVSSPAVGEFNAYNLSAALLALYALGYSFEEAISRVSQIRTPRGRVQFLDYGQDYKIVLDYAHTTDAFTMLYQFLDQIKTKRLITVTGSAGGREREKRGPMGKLVLDHSDYVIFTMDDPRNEDPNQIIDDLVSLSCAHHYERVIDRKEAIYRAFACAEPGDVVLIAGKGADNYMAIGDEYLPYSDLQVIDAYFKQEEII